MSERWVIGVDGGGTLTRALVLAEGGRELGAADGGAALTERAEAPVDLETVAGTVRRATVQAGLEAPAAVLCAGFAGVGRAAERLAVERGLLDLGLAARVRVITDAEAGFFDAFAEGPGLLLIAGTGSVAWGRGMEGRQVRVGGWGTILGDEGSGYAIGRRALQAVARWADGRGPETTLRQRLLEQMGVDDPEALIPWASGAGKDGIAGLAPLVCEAATAGDEVAAAIVDEAVEALRQHVAALLERLRPWAEPPGLALSGGLIAPGGALHGGLVAGLRGGGCRLLDSLVWPARGAARMALKDL